MSGTLEARFTGRQGAFQLDLDLVAPARGVSVLFGPSGCGKTTALRCMAGLTRLAGRFSVAGDVWQDESRFTPVHRRGVGYVFQEPSLFDHLSVRGNLGFGLKRAGTARRIGFDDVVGLLGLEPLLERGVAALSGGERQRAAIGRALLSQPALLLMDEPLASLDAARKAEVLPYLERLHDELAIPMVYVTHDLAEAMRLGDRLVLMAEGRVERVVELAAARPAAADGLTRRLGQIGPGALQSELAAGGVPPEAAGLAVAALIAGLTPWRGDGQAG
jgi:molybdate transport system ATP-binding protein